MSKMIRKTSINFIGKENIEVYEKIKLIAIREQRSFTWVIVNILKQYLNKNEQALELPVKSKQEQKQEQEKP